MLTKPDPLSEARAKRIWMQNIDTTVPWASRTYCFNFESGGIGVLYEKWVVSRNDSGGAAGHSRMSGSLQNQCNYPVLTFAQVEAIFKDAEATDDPLKVSFGRVIGLDDLRPSQVERLAVCPEMYVFMPNTQVVETKKDTSELVAKYKATIGKGAVEADTSAAPVVPEPVRRRAPRAEHIIPLE